jgi:DNA-binding NarL/FixJ family response regulator
MNKDSHAERERERQHPTAREIQVLRAVVECGTMERAAELLVVSPHTVDSTIDHLRGKSGFHTLAQITAWAITKGFWDQS